MPRKDIYWKNPAKHRAESRNRINSLVALGMRHLDQLSPAAVAKRRANNNVYCKTHRAANTLASRRYRRKLIRIFGNCSARSSWRHSQLKDEQHARKRKQAITPLLRKLVESRGRVHLVSDRYCTIRARTKGWGVVLLGRTRRYGRPFQLTRGCRTRACTVL